MFIFKVWKGRNDALRDEMLSIQRLNLFCSSSLVG